MWRRRVEIARALAAQPHFILLDEPLAGIDPIAVADIRDLVAHLKDRGIGVLITDHNVRETLEIVDRAYILHEGRVLMEGAPREIVADESVRRVYLGEKFSLYTGSRGRPPAPPTNSRRSPKRQKLRLFSASLTLRQSVGPIFAFMIGSRR